MHRTTCAVTLTLTLALVSACSTEDPQAEAASEGVSGRPPLPDLPAAPVGLTKGEFNVDRSGAASYRLAIEVPPGRAGMQPSIALSYDSNQGLGAAGYGWTIDGITRITRVADRSAASPPAPGAEIAGRVRGGDAEATPVQDSPPERSGVARDRGPLGS